MGMRRSMRMVRLVGNGDGETCERMDIGRLVGNEDGGGS